MNAVLRPEDEIKTEGSDAKALAHFGAGAISQRAVQLREAIDGGANRAIEVLRQAIEAKTPVEGLATILELHERIEDRKAAQELNIALMLFRDECKQIKHNRTASIPTKGGGSYSFTYAELDYISRTVDPLLQKYGLSYTWDTRVDERGTLLTATCILRHIAGASVTSSFTVPTASNAGMSDQQKFSSADTFARRKSLASVLGLTTTDDDIAPEQDPTQINDDQATVISDRIRELGVNVTRFLKVMNAKSIAEIRATDYEKAIRGLDEYEEVKRKKAAGAST